MPKDPKENPFKKRAELDAKMASLKSKLDLGQIDWDSYIKKIDKLVDKWNELEDAAEEWNETIKDAFENLEDVDGELRSIGNLLGKNSTLFEEQKKRIEKGSQALTSISNIIKDNGKYTEDEIKEINKIGILYKENLVSIANINKQYAQGKISLEEANKLIDNATDRYRENASAIKLSAEAAAEIGPIFEDMNKEVKSFGDLAKKSLQNIQALDNILGNFSGIPAMSEINTLIKTNIKDTLAWKAAVFALGAALGVAAYDYFGAPIKAGMQADRERQQNQIDGIAEIAKLQKDAEFIPSQISQERNEAAIEAGNEINRLTNDAAYASERAANSFSTSLKQGAAQFNAASKTALFGNKLGGVGYGAAQLQLAGISAEKIAGAMSSASTATGRMPTAKMATDMSIMADRTGTSVDDIAQITESFQRIDGMSSDMALNMAEGMRSMADKAGISLGNLMKEVSEASKEALGYQIKSGPALAKQVAFAQSLGVSFSDVAKAGKNMVLNYKDSIKAEMQLSSLLGEQVDLSEVRSKFAAGDTEGALKELQAQGLDPAEMDMFQQEALSQALGGMDLQSLSKIATKTGANVGELTAGKAGAANQQFLGATQAAQAALEAQQASISADAAIVDAQLSAKIADAYLASKEYESYKKAQNNAAQAAAQLAIKMQDAWLQTDAYKKSLADSMKLDFKSGIYQTLATGAAAVAGGAVTSLLGSGIKQLFSMFKGGAAAPVAAEVTGGGGGLIGNAAESLVPGAGGVAEAAIGGDLSGAAGAAADALIPGAGDIAEQVTSQVEEAKQPVEEVMTLGQKLKDFGQGLGSMLKDVGKGIGDFLKNTGTGLSQFLQQIGSGLGKAIGGFFSGIATGLTTFAMAMAAPTPLFGLPAGLIIVGMAMGIAQALSIAGPGIEKLTPLLLGLASIIGDTFVKVLKEAGPLITSIFNGIATVISSVGNSIATIIDSVANAVGKFAMMDSLKLGLVAASIGALAVSIGAFGVGNVLAAIGSFFGGSVFDELKDISGYASPLSATALAVESLANAFSALSNIDVSSLNKVPWGDMEDFAEDGGSFVIAQSANRSFNITEDTAKNIAKISTYHEKTEKLQNNTMIMLLKNLNVISEASFEMLSEIGKNTSTDAAVPSIKLTLDGKVVGRQLYNINQDYRITGTNTI